MKRPRHSPISATVIRPRRTGNGRARVASMNGAVLVTGGCGFVGANIADALAASGTRVVLFDNFARSGSEENAAWLRSRHPRHVDIHKGDIRNARAVSSVVKQASAVIHLAGQVAVTSSIESPGDDFEINARGTLNVLEAVRRSNPEKPVLFASTNKVYGKLFSPEAAPVSNGRHEPIDERYRLGVDESSPLDLHSPYGCSKGAADQYVHDYARVYGMRTVVLRMSCIYGPRQFGTEDQGWLAHFLIQTIRGNPITIYGDGRQVRDVLYVGDTVDAWLRTLQEIERTAGRTFNLGGGPGNAVSLLQAIDLIAELSGKRPALRFEKERPGDQPWYVSNTSSLDAAIEWRPRTPIHEGLRKLNAWLEQRFGRAGRRTMEVREATA